MGSFLPVAGIRHLHRNYNFTGGRVESALKSVRLSGGSAVSRQGISLREVRYSDGRRLLGLKFTASIALTDPLNLPAPGRRQLLYPDKEFRYLRMVIVTTAVYWGLSSVLRLR